MDRKFVNWKAASWKNAMARVITLKTDEERFDGEGRCSLLITFTANNLFDQLVVLAQPDPRLQADLKDKWEKDGIDLPWAVSQDKVIWTSGQNDRLKVVRDKTVTGRAEVPVRTILEAIVSSGVATGAPWAIDELYEMTKPGAVAEPPDGDLTYVEDAGKAATEDDVRALPADVYYNVRKDALYLQFTIMIGGVLEDGVVHNPLAELPIDMCIH